MKILAVDSSAKVASVCVFEDGAVISEQMENRGLTHSETLMPMIERTLEGAGLNLKDIDCFAVAAGPGSFTGLRIGVATVNALAHACAKPVVAVNTLEALAANVLHTEGRIAALMDARRHQVYAAVFDSDGTELKEAMKTKAQSISELCDFLSVLEMPVVLVGDGVDPYRTILEEQLGSYARFSAGHLRLQRASSVAYCAWKKLLGGAKGQERAEPEYFRLSQAERERNERLSQKGANA